MNSLRVRFPAVDSVFAIFIFSFFFNTNPSVLLFFLYDEMFLIFFLVRVQYKGHLGFVWEFGGEGMGRLWWVGNI